MSERIDHSREQANQEDFIVPQETAHKASEIPLQPEGEHDTIPAPTQTPETPEQKEAFLKRYQKAIAALAVVGVAAAAWGISRLASHESSEPKGNETVATSTPFPPSTSKAAVERTTEAPKKTERKITADTRLSLGDDRASFYEAQAKFDTPDALVLSESGALKHFPVVILNTLNANVDKIALDIYKDKDTVAEVNDVLLPKLLENTGIEEDSPLYKLLKDINRKNLDEETKARVKLTGNTLTITRTRSLNGSDLGDVIEMRSFTTTGRPNLDTSTEMWKFGGMTLAEQKK